MPSGFPEPPPEVGQPLPASSSRRWDGTRQNKALQSQSFGFKSAFLGAEGRILGTPCEEHTPHFEHPAPPSQRSGATGRRAGYTSCEGALAAPSPSPPKENKAGETSHRCALTPGLTQPLSFSSPQPCRQAPRLGVYAGTGTLPSLPAGPGSLAPGTPALPRSPSPTSVAPDSTKREREREGAGPGPFPSSSGRSRAAALSLGRFLKKGCWTSPIFATLSPKRPAMPHGKVQPLGEGERRLRLDAKAVSSFFQIKMDAPLESRIYPIDSEEGEDNCHQACKDSAKEVICPWEKPTEEGRAG
ncbi:regulator of G-protein signaling 9 [Strix uralensis]|uniref:regulator of G-protein signaling 9 n=1 Tax=Strix uralensis TaxID=36305 RepID=UPI003DA76B37